MAFAGPSYRDPEFYTAQVFSGLFGGGMSSRLFQEVRERRGLCYAIYSSCWALADTGLFGIHAATGPEMMGKLIDVVGEQLLRAAAEKPAEAELARAKAQHQGRPADGAGELVGPRRADGAPAPAVRPPDRAARADRAHRLGVRRRRRASWPPSSSVDAPPVGRRRRRRTQGPGVAGMAAERVATRECCVASVEASRARLGTDGLPRDPLLPDGEAEIHGRRCYCAIRRWATTRPGPS